MPNPYAAYTDSTEFVANYLYTAIQAVAQSTFGLPSHPPDNSVWYGDQDLLPTTPAVCVVPGPEQSGYNGVGGRPVLMLFSTFIMVYANQVRDIQANTHASLALANQIKHFVHADVTLGGNAIDILCAELAPGIAVRQGALMDATRMQFRTRSKVALNA